MAAYRYYGFQPHDTPTEVEKKPDAISVNYAQNAFKWNTLIKYMIKQFIMSLLGLKDSAYFKAKTGKITDSISKMKQELVQINSQRAEYRNELARKVAELEKELDTSWKDQESTEAIIQNISKTFLV